MVCINFDTRLIGSFVTKLQTIQVHVLTIMTNLTCVCTIAWHSTLTVSNYYIQQRKSAGLSNNSAKG